MNSRERVECVLRHGIPDRIPNCLGGCETAGLHVLAYRRLAEALGFPDRTPRVDTFMFNAVMDTDVLRAMRGDLLLVASPLMCPRPLRAETGWKTFRLFGTELLMTDDQSLETDEKGMMFLSRNGKRYAHCPQGCLYFDPLPDRGLLDDSEVPDPAGYHPRDSFPEETLRQLEETARRAWEETDLALCMGEAVRDLQLTPGGMVAWYDAMLNDPDVVGEYLEKATDAALRQITELDQAVGKYCCMLSIAHDLGDHRGVTMGAGLFRRIYKKHYHRLFHGWHERTGMKVNLHSCGAIAEILPDLIECGVDVLNPVQLSAAGMDAKKLKAIAGDRLVFYGGGLDCIQTPSGCSAQTVYEQVKRNIEALSAGGNYLFAGVHNAAADTPAEHLLAALRAWRDVCTAV